MESRVGGANNNKIIRSNRRQHQGNEQQGQNNNVKRKGERRPRKGSEGTEEWPEQGQQRQSTKEQQDDRRRVTMGRHIRRGTGRRNPHPDWDVRQGGWPDVTEWNIRGKTRRTQGSGLRLKGREGKKAAPWTEGPRGGSRSSPGRSIQGSTRRGGRGRVTANHQQKKEHNTWERRSIQGELRRRRRGSKEGVIKSNK